MKWNKILLIKMGLIMMVCIQLQCDSSYFCTFRDHDIMKFTVDSVSKEGCRLSSISKVGHHEDTIIKTPSCMMYTRGGSVPHLTLDMVQKIPHQSGIVQLTVPSFIEYRQTLETFQDGLAKFAGLPAKGVTFLSVQDPATTAPSGYNGKDAVSVWAPSGRVKLNATSFMSFERLSRPDIFQALCDGDTPEGCSKKRICKAVDRTLEFLDECLEKNIKTEDSDPVDIFGVIEGGDLLSERLRSAKETAKRPVSGFILDCFGESFLKKDTRWKLLPDVIKELPEDKPRMLPCVGHPLDVLQAIEMGVDLFDASYPYLITQKGLALVIPLDLGKNPESLEQQSHLTKDIDLILDLNEKRFADDFSPVASCCECYCCQNHTRAYINHLLVTKELLSGVLLMSHNLHQYFTFFQEIRNSIRANTFDKLKKRITEASR